MFEYLTKDSAWLYACKRYIIIRIIYSIVQSITFFPPCSDIRKIFICKNNNKNRKNANVNNIAISVISKNKMSIGLVESVN